MKPFILGLLFFSAAAFATQKTSDYCDQIESIAKIAAYSNQLGYSLDETKRLYTVFYSGDDQLNDKLAVMASNVIDRAYSISTYGDMVTKMDKIDNFIFKEKVSCSLHK